MTSVLADTHTFVWWFLDDVRSLSKKALNALESTIAAGNPIVISSITLVELTYLVEKGRFPSDALIKIDLHLKDPATDIRVMPVTDEIARELRHVARKQVPDMPDRIIAATAHYLDLPLVTRDGKIRSSGIKTVW